MTADALLTVTGLSKRFPGVIALADVSLSVGAGEVHALLGENGAGKSTLLKILSGAQQPDEGTIAFEGAPVRIVNPMAAQQLGIVTIYQEFNLIPHLTIAENVFIGREPKRGPFIDWRTMGRETRKILDRIGLPLDPGRTVRTLSVAEQQMVEIARALSMRSRVIIMDEPTSALSETEVGKLMAIVRDLRADGLSIIFVTHRLDEVMAICDRFTVLRDGRNAGAGAVADVTIDDIIRLMVGRNVEALFATRDDAHEGGVEALRVEHLSRHGDGRDPHAVVLDDISLVARRGEILGIAGLVGAGRTELARAIFGADPIDRGKVFVDGKQARIHAPHHAIRLGIGLAPEDRKQQALFLALAIKANISMATLDRLSRGIFVSEKAELAQVEEFRKALNIRMASPEQRVVLLSGGNQQKVVLARWLALRPRILIVDEPTRGIDVAAKAEVHQLLYDMARSGIAVIAISSELPEILTISDRIVTMRAGRITGEILRRDATEEKLMRMMTLAPEPSPAQAAE
ncbi:MAG: sugar ABC transporter ATP-binding protein [Alphaproteobacteria bacterium]